MSRFITTQYSDGSSTSWEWCEPYDGEWPYPSNCEEVIFKVSTKNPLYQDE